MGFVRISEDMTFSDSHSCRCVLLRRGTDDFTFTNEQGVGVPSDSAGDWGIGRSKKALLARSYALPSRRDVSWNDESPDLIGDCFLRGAAIIH